MSVWRVGHASGPCNLTPRHLYGWKNRFDDPQREYRTIYAGDKKETCFREVLADFRPNKTVLADLEKVMGPDESSAHAAGRVPDAWRRENVLAQADITISSGQMVDIESPPILKVLSNRLAEELQARKLKTINCAVIRSKDRELTRAASRALFDGGNAGIDFRSCLDGESCHALFEGRAHLTQQGAAISLIDPVPEMVAVCTEYGLKLGNG